MQPGKGPGATGGEGFFTMYELERYETLVREGGVAIFLNPVEPRFERHHRSYPELFDQILPRTTDPFEIWDTYAEDFAARPEYVYAYRYQFSFHGAHPLFLWGQTAFARRHLGRPGLVARRTALRA